MHLYARYPYPLRVQFSLRSSCLQISQFNFILVLGAEEQAARTVNVRSRDNTRIGIKTLDEVLAFFNELTATHQ